MISVSKRGGAGLPHLSRREFLKMAGGTSGLLLAGGLLLPSTEKSLTGARRDRIKWGRATTTICPYDATGCGFVVYTEDGKMVNVEGDADHPINQGSACAKGASLAQLHNSDRRLSKVLYRRPGGKDWEEKTWGWALEEIAHRIKETRDASWMAKDAQGLVVNRTEAVASLGGAALDNEECYLLSKFMRSLGLVYIEHQARI